MNTLFKTLFLSLVATTVFANTQVASPNLPSSDFLVMGPLNHESILQITLWLKLRDKEKLDQLVSEIYDRNSPHYQQFLTKNDFEQHYAPSAEVENAVQHYFTSQGIQAEIVNHSVRVTGTVAQIERALHTQINYYNDQNRIVYANATTPSLSDNIAPYISEISGLSNIAQFQPMVKTHGPLAQPTTTSIGGFTGAELITTYNLANIPQINHTKIDGTGQTIVIIDSCGADKAAVITNNANSYNQANGLSRLTLGENFAVINPDGSSYTSCGTSGETGWETEIALDVEAAHTVAPGANIVLVLAANQNDLEKAVADVIGLLSKNNYTIAGFSNAYIVSNSWGTWEGSGYFPSMETNLETAAAFGISFNFSSGDCGDNTYNSEYCDASTRSASVNYPASSAYVTAVGGTSLFVDNNWNYAFETGWGTYERGYVFGSGGGISQHYGPVAWQNSIDGFTAGGYKSGTVGHYNKRALPDIAMLGDLQTGLDIYASGSSKPMTVGGTSLACPLFSGTLALVNQARSLSNINTPIGLAAPYLYQENNALLNSQALYLITPPHQIINGATRAPQGAPVSAFTLEGMTYGWDSSLTTEPQNQFWNDVVGVGSPNIIHFVSTMANF